MTALLSRLGAAALAIAACVSCKDAGKAAGDAGDAGNPDPVADVLLWDDATHTLTYGDHSYEMMPVPGGVFTMGGSHDIGTPGDDEFPAHTVKLSSFHIGATEVPQWLWKAVMGSNPSCYKVDNRPVEQVSWDDCHDFIARLDSITGAAFTLPTEAQWEYAARGGASGGTLYSGSDDIDQVAWYKDNSDRKTHEVGVKAPNSLGLYDMSGNVFEWCADWYGPYSAASQTDPTGPATGTYRVVRGGGWSGSYETCAVSHRRNRSPEHRYSVIGLRLAMP